MVSSPRCTYCGAQVVLTRTVAALALLLTGCGLVGWLAEPVGGTEVQEVRACACPEPGASRQGGLPQAASALPPTTQPGATRAETAGSQPVRADPPPAVPRTSRGAVIIDDTATVAGMLTGNPLIWTLGAQLAHLVFGTGGLARRRKQTT